MRKLLLFTGIHNMEAWAAVMSGHTKAITISVGRWLATDIQTLHLR